MADATQQHSSPLRHVTDRARQIEADYSGEEQRPLGGYIVLLSTYAVGTGAGIALARWKGRTLPARVAVGDLAQIAVATFHLGRLLTKKAITSPLRAPFTVFDGPAGNAELHEAVPGTGIRHAIGELLTCPFCMEHWIATGFGFGIVLAPRATRLVAGLLTAEAAADFLQFAHAAVERRA